jgi:hypothetical protein
MLRSWAGSSHSATHAAGNDNRVLGEWATVLAIVTLPKWNRTGRTMPVPASASGGGLSLFSIATVACRCVVPLGGTALATRTTPSTLTAPACLLVGRSAALVHPDRSATENAAAITVRKVAGTCALCRHEGCRTLSAKLIMLVRRSSGPSGSMHGACKERHAAKTGLNHRPASR